MRFRRLIAIVAATAASLGVTAACDTSSVSQEVKQVASDAARAELERQLVTVGFTNVEVEIEDETADAQRKAAKKATPAPKASASSKAPAKADPASKVQLLSATFRIPGSACSGNVEQPFKPQLGLPYFDEVIFPNGDEEEVKGAARKLTDLTAPTTPTVIINYVGKFEQCRELSSSAPVPANTP